MPITVPRTRRVLAVFLILLSCAPAASTLTPGAVPAAAAAVMPKLPAFPVRDAALYPPGYLDGDPLPPATVYLTFDDGPSDFTDGILDILAAEGVRATFFINSFDRSGPTPADPAVNVLRAHAAILRRMVEAGHAVGGHGFAHRDWASVGRAARDADIATLDRHFAEAFGPGAPRLWAQRPPYGSPWLGAWGTAAMKRAVAASLAPARQLFMWTTGWDSADSLEWAEGEWWNATSPRYRPGGPAWRAKVERTAARLLARADGVNSGFVLFHDNHPTSRDALAAVIKGFKARGYRFATVADWADWRYGPGSAARFDAGT